MSHSRPDRRDVRPLKEHRYHKNGAISAKALNQFCL